MPNFQPIRLAESEAHTSAIRVVLLELPGTLRENAAANLKPLGLQICSHLLRVSSLQDCALTKPPKSSMLLDGHLGSTGKAKPMFRMKRSLIS